MSSKILKEKYANREKEIGARLADFKKVFEESDRRVFEELAFCLCTPQSKALSADKAITSLRDNGLLYKGNAEQIKPFLNTVRFNETKAKRIVMARELFTEGSGVKIKERLLSLGTPEEMRAWLIENVNGFGPKEASHFLRNVGFGKTLGILDVHILKNLERYGVIDEIPKTMTHKKYFEIEEKMKNFAEENEIPFDALDLLFWSEQTGIIFK